MWQLHLVFGLFLILVCFQNKVNGSSSVVFNQCGKTISRYQFILQSPGYPNNYPTNLNCEFILEAHHSCPTEYHFQLVDFELPFSRNCSNRLEIIGHESICGLATGVRMYKTQTGQNLHLRFTSSTATTKGKGFKIVITRLPCMKLPSASLSVSRSSVPAAIPIPNLPGCCADSYNSRRFFLSSPEFPNSNNYPHDCIYKIYRANPNICRLRIHARYFWTGRQETNCNDGYLEIDGKKICGCQTELDIISQFDQFWGNNPKIIRYKNSAHSTTQHQTNYNGFVIEVIQDECPTRYSPGFDTNSSTTTISEEKTNKVPQFYYYNDQLNRVRFPAEKNAEMFNRKPSKLIDYYFFRAPDNDDFIEHNTEERNYFETTDPNAILPNTNNIEKCINWSLKDYQSLIDEVLWKKMPKCLQQQVNTNCYDVKLQNGYLVSPGYSFYNYPSNIDCCYRFHKINGYCGIHFSVLDFQLEPSYNCDKDAFILYNKYKYCGMYLHNKYFKFDLSSRVFEDIKFKTDAYYCNKGFKIYFEHVPCTSIVSTPVYQPPVTTPATEKLCGGNIRLEIFDVTISTANEECVYVVEKLNQNVCGVEILLIELNLSCEHEYLMINNEQFCGRVSGQTKWVTFDPGNLVTIAYRRRIDHRPVLTSIVLRGQQITEDCDPFMCECYLPPYFINCSTSMLLDVPAQRRLKIPT